MAEPRIELDSERLKKLLKLRDSMDRENRRVGGVGLTPFGLRTLRLLVHCERVVQDILDDLPLHEEEWLREEMRQEAAEIGKGERADAENDEAWLKRQGVV